MSIWKSAKLVICNLPRGKHELAVLKKNHRSSSNFIPAFWDVKPLLVVIISQARLCLDIIKMGWVKLSWAILMYKAVLIYKTPLFKSCQFINFKKQLWFITLLRLLNAHCKSFVDITNICKCCIKRSTAINVCGCFKYLPHSWTMLKGCINLHLIFCDWKMLGFNNSTVSLWQKPKMHIHWYSRLCN